jgi:DNA polymerase-3 subunit gamma/tau
MLREGAPAAPAATRLERPQREEPPATVNAAPAQASNAPFQKFEDVTAAVAEERDIELELALERMKVVRFSATGEIVYVANAEQPRDLVRRLKAFLEERTPFEWTIRATNEAVTPVERLAERRKREEARALEELKKQPFVAEALKHFPNAEVAAVRQPVEETDGDVAPFPQRDAAAPSPARKKEAEQ